MIVDYTTFAKENKLEQLSESVSESSLKKLEDDKLEDLLCRVADSLSKYKDDDRLDTIEEIEAICKELKSRI